MASASPVALDQIAITLAERGNPALLGRHLVGPSRFNLYRHTRLIAAKVAEAAMTPNGRLIIVMPPRYGKTLLTSILLPLWFLECFPDKRVILASYAAELSRLNSREARNLIASYPDRLRLRLAQDSKAAYRWNTPEGGGLLSTGVDGTMTGFGADLVCLDDLYKDWRSAHSPTVRQGTWDWYRSVPRQRLEPGASIVVTMTRWHEEDLVGQILTGADDEDPYPWQVLRLPAVAEPTDEEPDPLGRAEGEVLCPERFDEVAVHSAMRDAGPYLAAGMFQQRPAAREGTMFRAQRWGDAPALPASLRGLVRWWDLAATEGAGDYTAGVLLAVDHEGYVYVADVVHGQMAGDDVERAFLTTTAADRDRFGNEVHTVIEQEPGASGKIVAQGWVRKIGGRAEAKPNSGDKEVRATPLSAQQLAGNVRLVRNADGSRPAWWDLLIGEATLFPNGRNDDIIDGASSAYNYINAKPRRSKARARTAADRSI